MVLVAVQSDDGNLRILSDLLMHLTCTNLTCDELKQILKAAKEMGIQNILALRGDPAKGGTVCMSYGFTECCHMNVLVLL